MATSCIRRCCLEEVGEPWGWGAQEDCRAHFWARGPLTSSYSLPHTPVSFSLTSNPFTTLLHRYRSLHLPPYSTYYGQGTVKHLVSLPY